MIIRPIGVFFALATCMISACAPFNDVNNHGNWFQSSYKTPLPPTPVPANPFLTGLSERELQSVKSEAMRVYGPIWKQISARSRYVRQPMIQTLKQQHAPLALQMIPVVESGYNPYAVSEVGATGLWQLMPDTATDLRIKSNHQLDGRRDIARSSRGAARFLLKQHAHFGSWPLAFAAYHLGPNGVQRRINRHPWHDGDGLRRLPLPPITKTYIRHILGLIALRDSGTLTFPAPYPTSTVKLHMPVDLAALQRASGLPARQIYRFNPKLQLQQYFHHARKTISVRVPTHRLHRLTNNLPKTASAYLTITILKGETLRHISRRYHVSVYQLQQANRHFSGKLKPGQLLRIPASAIEHIVSVKNPLVREAPKLLANND